MVNNFRNTSLVSATTWITFIFFDFFIFIIYIRNLVDDRSRNTNRSWNSNIVQSWSKSVSLGRSSLSSFNLSLFSSFSISSSVVLKSDILSIVSWKGDRLSIINISICININRSVSILINSFSGDRTSVVNLSSRINPLYIYVLSLIMRLNVMMIYSDISWNIYSSSLNIVVSFNWSIFCWESSSNVILVFHSDFSLIVDHTRLDDALSVNFISLDVNCSIKNLLSILGWKGYYISFNCSSFLLDIVWLKSFGSCCLIRLYYNSLSCRFCYSLINNSWLTNNSFGHYFWFL